MQFALRNADKWKKNREFPDFTLIDGDVPNSRGNREIRGDKSYR